MLSEAPKVAQRYLIQCIILRTMGTHLSTEPSIVHTSSFHGGELLSRTLAIILIAILSPLNSCLDFSSTIIFVLVLLLMANVKQVGQMTQLDLALFVSPETGVLDEQKLLEWITRYRIGSLFNTPFAGHTGRYTTPCGFVSWDD